MVMKHLYIKNQFGGRGQAVLITGGLIGVAGILEVVMADTDTMVADMVVEDIGVGLARGEEVVVVDLVVEAVVEVVEAVVEAVEEVAEAEVAADVKKSI
jgi:hypothetical protein